MSKERAFINLSNTSLREQTRGSRIPPGSVRSTFRLVKPSIVDDSTGALSAPADMTPRRPAERSFDPLNTANDCLLAYCSVSFVLNFFF
jgi:hypothetical protein